ncbi:hypothetical protein AVEN_247939-1 [Araneus ventricosus]|uniref:Uncharacterized protein n=1 Tax=Araneus ventricosus TaxID=182803 RepID=A0A4Y2CJF1_ARAVE|nr:hypothetical protein AVEN_247939-1 [Araneus ventricosus]
MDYLSMNGEFLNSTLHIIACLLSMYRIDFDQLHYDVYRTDRALNFLCEILLGKCSRGLHVCIKRTECIYTVSWHMRKSAPNFEQEWLKRVANNLVSRQKIRGIIKFISENRDLFLPP